MQVDLFTGETIVEKAILRLREFEPEAGYYLAFSGGKDSSCIKALADLAGVKYDAHYNATTLDPPELVRFIKRTHPDVAFIKPKRKLVDAFVYHRFPPTRRIRWCCRDLKEGGGKGRTVVLGIRWAESSSRSKRKMVEQCYTDTSKKYLNPIIDWSDEDVWWFIRKYDIPYCELYDEGHTRLGCVICPMATKRQRRADAKRWPHMERHWRRAFQAMWDAGPKTRPDWGKFKTVDDIWNWWFNDLHGYKADEAQECFRLTDN